MPNSVLAAAAQRSPQDLFQDKGGVIFMYPRANTGEPFVRARASFDCQGFFCHPAPSFLLYISALPCWLRHDCSALEWCSAWLRIPAGGCTKQACGFRDQIKV